MDLPTPSRGKKGHVGPQKTLHPRLIPGRACHGTLFRPSVRFPQGSRARLDTSVVSELWRCRRGQRL